MLFLDRALKRGFVGLRGGLLFPVWKHHTLGPFPFPKRRHVSNQTELCATGKAKREMDSDELTWLWVIQCGQQPETQSAASRSTRVTSKGESRSPPSTWIPF